MIFLLFKFVFIKICQINLVLAENSDFLIFFTPSGCNNIGIRKFKPVAKTQFFFLDCEKRMKQNQSLEKSQRLFFFFFWSTFILVHENNLEVCYDLSNFWRDPSENQKLLNFQFHWRSGGVQWISCCIKRKSRSLQCHVWGLQTKIWALHNEILESPIKSWVLQWKCKGLQ